MTGGAPFSLIQFSIRHPPPSEGWLMAALQGFFDDSGDDTDPRHNAICFAGYVGNVDAWTAFDRLWPEALAKHGVPYSHMKDFAHFIPPFDKWKGKDKVEERRGFLQSLVAVVRDCGLAGFGTLVRLDDIRSFNSDKGLALDPIAIALYGCMIELHQRYGGKDHIELTVDHFDKPHSKIELAEKYAETDTYYPGCGRNISMLALSRDLTFRDVPGLQIADYAAYELKKFHEVNNEWYAKIAPTIDRARWWQSLMEYQLKRDGRVSMPGFNRRGSLNALSGAATIEGGVWDYPIFEACHAARKGVWPI
jgi:hypothetical protein